MATEIYGASDDLIEFDGDVHGEVPGGDDPTLLMCSDGTFLTIKYGKEHLAIWSITLLREGSLFERIDLCLDGDADRYSDTAHFADGLEWAYSASKWKVVD